MAHCCFAALQCSDVNPLIMPIITFHGPKLATASSSLSLMRLHDP